MQVSLDPEETLDFEVFQDRALTESGGRMVFQGVLEPRASLERYWEPHLEDQDRTVYQGHRETRASPGHQEDLDYLVGLRQGDAQCYTLKSGVSIIYSTPFISMRVGLITEETLSSYIL